MSNPNPSPKTRFQPGQSGNTGGRPKGTMKDYLRRKFIDMSDEEKELFAKNISAEMQVKFAEGMPKQENEHRGTLTISQVLDNLDNGQTISEQTMESEPSLQDSEQRGEVDTIPAQ